MMLRNETWVLGIVGKKESQKMRYHGEEKLITSS